MKTFAVELTEEERDALIAMAEDAIRTWPDRYYVGPMTKEREALRKLRDTEPNETERVR